jgi:uncharacterized protein (DUF58 family)
VRPSDLASFDWGRLSSLRIRARAIADGTYVGSHRSARRGTGVEFGGHRNYVPGDDLRRLDRHALMRHSRLLVREYESETDRALRLVVDASLSMGYQSPGAPVSKLTYATTLAAALARLAILDGDPVALDWIAGSGTRWLASRSGHEAFERVIGVLEIAEASGSLVDDMPSFEQAVAPVLRYAGRGAVVVVLSDLLDLPEGGIEWLAGLARTGRTLLVIRILDPAEQHFPFTGPSRFRALEGHRVVETDATQVRSAYLAALAEQTRMLRTFFTQRGATIVFASTTDDPVDIVAQAVHEIGARRK